MFVKQFSGIAYNMATSGGSGGNTTTGQTARRFYSSLEMRERLVAMVPEEHRDNFREILFTSEYPKAKKIFNNKTYFTKHNKNLCTFQLN